MRHSATIKAAVTVAVIGLAAFVVSGIPRFKNAKSGDGADYLMGEIAWVTFLVCALTLIVLGLLAAARIIRRLRSPAA
ncbi:MAG TPA: hypothetical protein VF288_02810 [Mycobacteriales bacterium]